MLTTTLAPCRVREQLQFVRVAQEEGRWLSPQAQMSWVLLTWRVCSERRSLLPLVELQSRWSPVRRLED
jgi:hypothetical protein